MLLYYDFITGHFVFCARHALGCISGRGVQYPAPRGGINCLVIFAADSGQMATC